MRVLFVVGQFPAVSETFILGQATGLIDRGHELDIYAIAATRAVDGIAHDDVFRYGLAKRAFYLPGPHKGRLPRVLRGASLAVETAMRRPRTLLAWARARQRGAAVGTGQCLSRALPLIRRRRYDIVHCQFGTVAIPLLPLRSIGVADAPLVVSFRGYDISRFVREHGAAGYREVFAAADLFLPNCDYFKRRLVALGCDERRIVVHRSGLDLARFPLVRVRPPFAGLVRIVMVGRLVEKKGTEYAIRAVGRLVRRGHRIELIVIGDGPLALALRSLAADLGVPDHVRFTGWQDQRRVAEWLADSHLVVAPSVTAADGDEDAPVNALKEAMATGRPVVATRHGGIPELVEEGVSGFLVPERDAIALAERLEYLVTHPGVWPAMGAAGCARVARDYDLKHLNDRLVETYRDLLGRTRR
jgi:colanic acid/amylovoran biosynthesis glycosyltransferase